jgi:hypothetical protein
LNADRPVFKVAPSVAAKGHPADISTSEIADKSASTSADIATARTADSLEGV